MCTSEDAMPGAQLAASSDDGADCQTRGRSTLPDDMMFATSIVSSRCATPRLSGRQSCRDPHNRPSSYDDCRSKFAGWNDICRLIGLVRPASILTHRQHQTRRAAWVSLALLLLGLAPFFASDVKATPQAGFEFAQLEVTSDPTTQDDNRLTPCPLCGRLVCSCRCDDQLGTESPDDASLLATSASSPVLGSLPLPRPYASRTPHSTFFASFEPRGPPLPG